MKLKARIFKCKSEKKRLKSVRYRYANATARH
jgi:hypothetical protein